MVVLWQIYIFLVKNIRKKLVIRTHMLMYGKNINYSDNNRYFMKIDLDDNTTISWYACQIKLLNLN